MKMLNNKMVIKRFFIILIFCVLAKSSFCQRYYVKTDNEKLGRDKLNTLYYEYWGAGGSYSLNYGREIQLFGPLYTIPTFGIERLHKDSYSYSFIVRNDFDIKFGSNAINFGGAIVLGRLSLSSEYNFGHPQNGNTSYNRLLCPSLGYSRYFFKGIIFCNLSGFAIRYFKDNTWYPYMGMRVGVKF